MSLLAAAMYSRWLSYSDEVNRMVAIGAKIGWETGAAVFQDDAFGKDALVGLQVGAARERANVIATIPVDRAAPDLAAAVAAVNKARPSVVMVFLPPGPATKFIRTLKESGYTGAVASLDQRHSGGDQGHRRQEPWTAVPRVLPRPNDSDQPAGGRIHESDEGSGQGGSAARPLLRLRGGQDHG